VQTRYCFFCFVIIFRFLLSTGMSRSCEPKIWKGIVVDSVTDSPLSFVHILNESTRRGYISDSSGKFSIECSSGDTLVFISLGYLGKVIIVDILEQEVQLVPRIYSIDEVSIQTYRSYEQFRHDFLKVQPEKDLEIKGLPRGKPIDVPVLLDTNQIQSPAFLLFHPLSFLYYNFSKEEKSKRKAFYLERRKGEEIVVQGKFNREIIHQITGLEGDDLTNFIGFCNFSHEFLYESTELEIVNKIYEKFDAYKLILKKHEESEAPDSD